jgi:hypothetical protein
MNSNFLQEDNGNFSTVRLIPIVSLFFAFILAILAINMGSTIALDLAKTFLIYGTGGGLVAKIAQKPMEEKV